MHQRQNWWMPIQEGGKREIYNGVVLHAAAEDAHHCEGRAEPQVILAGFPTYTPAVGRK